MPRTLELNAGGELELARTAISVRHASVCFAGDVTSRRSGRCIEDVGVTGITRVDVVEHVEGIHPELRHDALPNRERFGDRHVGTEEGWATVCVCADVPDHTQPGPGEDAAGRGLSSEEVS